MRYPACVTEADETRDETRRELQRVGLCLDCLHAQRIQSDRGSTFYRCKLSDTDPSFPKYPRLPVLQCAGYARKVKGSDL
jgi:hypothetical protein